MAKTLTVCQAQGRPSFLTRAIRPPERPGGRPTSPDFPFRTIGGDPRHLLTTLRSKRRVWHLTRATARPRTSTGPASALSPAIQRKTPRCAEAHLGYDGTDHSRLHTRLRVGRPTPGRSSFGVERSRRRLFSRRSEAPEVLPDLRIVSNARATQDCLQLRPEPAKSAPNDAPTAVTSADNVVRSRELWVTQKPAPGPTAPSPEPAREPPVQPAQWRAALQAIGYPTRAYDFIIPGDLGGARYGVSDPRTGARHFSKNQAHSWGARFFTPTVNKVAEHHEFFAILGATPYALRRGGISLRLRAEDPQTVASECGTSLKTLSDHYAFAIEDLRENGPRPVEVEWRAARVAQAERRSREEALRDVAERGGANGQRRSLLAWFSSRRRTSRAS